MKGKKFLALASIFAGVALVGTTFAAWAVTDNAGTKHIKVSGGKISADTTTTYVNYANMYDIDIQRMIFRFDE